MQLRVENGTVALRTRKGLDWTDKFRAIAKAAETLPDCIVDGEVVALDRNGVPDFAALQAAISECKSEQMTCYAFDLLFLEGEDLRSIPLVERKSRLERLLARSRGPIRFTEHFHARGDTVIESACRMALEGIISKRLRDPYRSGRAGQWMKTKCRGGQEVVIGGWTDTDGKFRSLLVGVNRGDQLVSAGRVGTGFSREKARTSHETTKRSGKPAESLSRQRAAPRPQSNVHWVKPELVAEIEFAGWTADEQVRQASYKGLREDKPAPEIRAETAGKTSRTPGRHHQ